MKTAVIFIGTSEYLNFLPDWYESCEEYLLPDSEKTYFVFTDGSMEGAPDNIVVRPTEHKSWPFVTLYRFKYIKECAEQLKEYDAILFVDADMKVVDKVTQKELFVKGKDLIGVHHPCHHAQMPPHNEFPGAFETDPNSLAHVTGDIDFSTYWQGCFWGGRSKAVLAMIEELDRRITVDEERGIVAKWHDESHLNRYFLDNIDKVHTLHPMYAYPEVFADHLDYEPKIVHLAKENSKYQV